MLTHAKQDDLVYVPGFEDGGALIFYAGDYVLYGCTLDENTPLPKKKVAELEAPLYIEHNTPDWIIGFGGLRQGTMEQFAASYEVVVKLKVYPYPTQRPELNMHAFSPLDPGNSGVYILRRKK